MQELIVLHHVYPTNVVALKIVFNLPTHMCWFLLSFVLNYNVYPAVWTRILLVVAGTSIEPFLYALLVKLVFALDELYRL